MSKKAGAILLAVLLVVCAAAVGMANEGLFSGGENQVQNAGAEAEGNQEGPPEWAPQHARERWEWSQTGDGGPPPWAKGKGKGSD